MDLSQANRLAAMAQDMTEQPDLQHTFDRILSNAAQTIACDAVGVVLLRDGVVETAAASDALVTSADALQLECREGPCSRLGQRPDIVLIDDTLREDRWPVWSKRVAGLGWRAVLSVQLATPVRLLGALNIYARNPHVFGADDTELAEVFGRHASMAVASAQYVDSLRNAVVSRHVIGQAQGILMERYQVDADRAFTILRRYSQDQNIKLRAIADKVIATHRLPD